MQITSPTLVSQAAPPDVREVIAVYAFFPASYLNSLGLPPMIFLLNYPLVFFVITLALLWIASRVGAYFRKQSLDDEGHFSLILGATLTLLGLMIGFTFAMAVSRYDQRKGYEEQEANAIGTEYVRLDVLSAAKAAELRALLRDYLDQRILFYTSRDSELLRQARAKISQLQSELWSEVTPSVSAQPNPVSALVLSGMNDVLNSAGYTEAAWRNRVPIAAWILLISIAAFCNFLLGYRAQRKTSMLLLVLPISLALSFFLIADIDSPRNGVIRVDPQNLESLADSLRPH
jgi:hypothetical protein